MIKVTRILIVEKRESGCRKNKLLKNNTFELLFEGYPAIDTSLLCWKEVDSTISLFGKVLFRQYKNGRVRIKKGNTFYYSSKGGVEGTFKETHPEDR